MVMLTAFRLLRDILVEAKELRTAMHKRYPYLGS